MRAGVFASIGRLHIVAIAGLGALTFGWLMSGTRLWAVVVVVCLDWFIVNLLNRVVDLEEDLANAITGSDVVRRNRAAVLWQGGGMLLGSLIVVQLLMPALTPWRVGYHLLGAAYNWPLLPGGRRLKTLYLAKNTASAAGFLITLFGYPLAQMSAAGAPLTTGFGWPQVGQTALFFFLFELSWEVVYDLRDEPGDRLAGVRTFAVVHGPDRAAQIADALLLGSALTLVISHTMFGLPWRVFVMIIAPVMQWFLYRRWRARGLTSADVIRLTWLGAGLLAAYHGWIALGLPGVRGPPWS